MSKRLKLFFFAGCLVIGILIACQIKISDGQRLYVSPQTAEDYKTTINSEKEEIKKLKEMVSEAKQKLEAYEDASEEEGRAEEEIEKNLLPEVENYKIASGYGKIKGSGVEVIIDDGVRALYEGEDVNNLLVHDMDIIMIVNELKRYGAEVISVNGQRITANTAISCSGYTMRINGEVYARPFKIKAIGDGRRMAAALVGPDGYGTSLKNWGIQVEVRVKDDLIIEPLANEYQYRYMTKVQGEVKN
ncbi:MAG: DUF881 domain-containing protein [Anaerovoracaceae bacterium]